MREALKRPHAERAPFLDGACAGDAGLRQRVERLLLPALKSSDAAPSEPTAAAESTVKVDLVDAADASIGQTIGRYKVLQKIGEGGCGAVYMAEQEQPVRRRVALKVIKLGMDTKAVIARFEAERQALALMDHPNIARVLDAGATEVGRPYFVMELVRGIKFTDYCDQNHLNVRQRLELFTQICQAIQHAHQKGIIHRDIKPSNILVTLHDGVPVPKVIDFGIAKATTDQRLTDKTLFTAYEQFIGTPAYMSPEQAEMSGLDIDTRSDIYSLGVLLYELLTGRTPFDPKELMESGLEGMRKTIREKDPLRPSTKLHTLAGEELTTTAKSHGWNAATRQTAADFPLEGSCLGLAFARDGRTLAASTISRSGGTASGNRGSITLYRMPEGTKLSSFPSKPSGVDPGILFACAADLSVGAYAELARGVHLGRFRHGFQGNEVFS